MNIAIYLPGWIGDAVMATPCLRAVRKTFPEAKITAIAKPYVLGALEGGNWFDELWPVSSKGLDQGLMAMVARLRQKKFDYALLLPNSFRSAFTVFLGGCRRRIGYARSGRSLLLTDKVKPVYDDKGGFKPSPVVDAYNTLAMQMGCPDPGHGLHLFTTEKDEQAADQVWNSLGWDRTEEVVCLNTGGAFGLAKLWPSSSFSILAKKMVSARNCKVLILCGPSEKDLALRIARDASDPRIQALAAHTQPCQPQGPSLSLGLSKAIVRRSNLLVTTDSGPRHFAHAFNRPVVTLFGPTHIAWTETYHPKAIHLQEKVSCGPCQKRVCPLDHRCMTQLSPERVYQASVTLLDSNKKEAA